MNPSNPQKMTAEQRERILEREKQKFRRIKFFAAAVLIPLVLGYLLLRVQVSNELVAGTMQSVSVSHKATGTKIYVVVKLDNGAMAEVLLPRTIQFKAGDRIQMTEAISIIGTRRYVYPKSI